MTDIVSLNEKVDARFRRKRIRFATALVATVHVGIDLFLLVVIAFRAFVKFA